MYSHDFWWACASCFALSPLLLHDRHLLVIYIFEFVVIDGVGVLLDFLTFSGGMLEDVDTVRLCHFANNQSIGNLIVLVLVGGHNNTLEILIMLNKCCPLRL